ncbi:MAG: hypothetical protein K2X87_31175, partial [Gemmataceae bacterium]|nr:hypothetical protein [Gemmataceae bacterium]
MAKHTLVIHGGDPNHFLLAVDDGTVRIADGPAHAGGVLRDLRVVRVRCEVEFQDDRDEVPIDEPGVLTRRALRPGAALQLGRAGLSLAGVDP